MHLPSEKRVLTKIQLESKGGSMDFLNREHRPITLYYYFVILLCTITLYYYFVGNSILSWPSPFIPAALLQE